MGNRSARPFSYLPREHGAYVQLLGPLLCALLFASRTPLSLAIGAAACAAFLAHEPLLVVLGRRGERVRAARARGATLLLAGLTLLVSTVVAWAAIRERAVAPALLIPGGLSLVAGVMVLRGRERTLSGQLLSAAALASFSVPVLVASRLPLAEALKFAVGWLLVHVAATCAARAYVYRKRHGEAQLYWAAGFSIAMTATCVALQVLGKLPLYFALATLPFAVVATLLASRVLLPRSPKTLGWILTGANLLAFLAFGFSLLQQS